MAFNVWWTDFLIVSDYVINRHFDGGCINTKTDRSRRDSVYIHDMPKLYLWAAHYV